MWPSPSKKCLLCVTQNSFIFSQRYEGPSTMHFFRTLKSWMYKINGLEVFLGHSSQKYFLNLLLQENTLKPNQNRKQTKTSQNKARHTRKAPEVFHASILKERLKFRYLDIYWWQRQQFHLETGVGPSFGGTCLYRVGGWTHNPRLILGSVGSAGSAASHGAGTPKHLVLHPKVTPGQEPGWARDSSLILRARRTAPFRGFGGPEAGRASLPPFIYHRKLPLFFLFRTKAPLSSWDGLGSSGVGQGAGDHWLHIWEEVGVGLSFLCLWFDLFASRLFWFSTWRDLGTLSKVQTPRTFPAGSSRALGSAKPSQGAGLHSSITHSDCFMHKFGHFMTFFFYTGPCSLSASQKFPWKSRNLCLLYFFLFLFFIISPKDLREIAEMISSRSNSIFLLQQNFLAKFVSS